MRNPGWSPGGVRQREPTRSPGTTRCLGGGVESPGHGCSPRWKPTATNLSSPRMGNVSISPLHCMPGRTRIFERWFTVCPLLAAHRFSWLVVLNRRGLGRDPGLAVTAEPCFC